MYAFARRYFKPLKALEDSGSISPSTRAELVGGGVDLFCRLNTYLNSDKPSGFLVEAFFPDGLSPIHDRNLSPGMKMLLNAFFSQLLRRGLSSEDIDRFSPVHPHWRPVMTALKTKPEGFYAAALENLAEINFPFWLELHGKSVEMHEFARRTSPPLTPAALDRMREALQYFADEGKAPPTWPAVVSELQDTHVPLPDIVVAVANRLFESPLDRAEEALGNFVRFLFEKYLAGFGIIARVLTIQENSRPRHLVIFQQTDVTAGESFNVHHGDDHFSIPLVQVTNVLLPAEAPPVSSLSTLEHAVVSDRATRKKIQRSIISMQQFVRQIQEARARGGQIAPMSEAALHWGALAFDMREGAPREPGLQRFWRYAGLVETITLTLPELRRLLPAARTLSPSELMRHFVEQYVRKDRMLGGLYAISEDMPQRFMAEWISQAFHILSAAAHTNTTENVLGDIFWQTFAYDQASPEPPSLLIVLLLLERLAPDSGVTLPDLLDPVRQKDALLKASTILQEFEPEVLNNAARAALEYHFKIRYDIVGREIFVEDEGTPGVSPSLAPVLAGGVLVAAAAIQQALNLPHAGATTLSAAVNGAAAALVLGAAAPRLMVKVKAFIRQWQAAEPVRLPWAQRLRQAA
jgi:hypothetical protein